MMLIELIEQTVGKVRSAIQGLQTVPESTLVQHTEIIYQMM